MPDYCAVPHCNGYGGFKFPSDPALNLKWRVAIKRLGQKKTLWKPSQRAVVCDKHFKAEDFKEPVFSIAHLSGRSRRNLKPGVVPSIFPFAAEAPSTSNRALRVENRSRKKTEVDYEAEVPVYVPGNFFYFFVEVVTNLQHCIF